MPTDEYPRSEQDARNHIRKLRQDRGVDDVMGDLKSNATTEDLQELLNVVAADLYQSPTHFILELIQNTDDNHYKPGVNPTVIMTKGDKTFRMDCNERGFTKQNVESICRSGKSSKKGANKSVGYTGEKGIGFKSVFRVAREVYIKSGHFSFKFNRDIPLGMVIPHWEAFPEPVRDGYTSFFFRLADDYNEAELTRALAMLDSGLLMFLRKLKRIEVNIKGVTSSLSSKVLVRQDKGDVMRELSMGDKITKCFVFRHTVNNLPKEDRRPNMNSSEITLGFPFSFEAGQIRPVTAQQQVYAFLPVRGYGLSFMIQSDFVLVANREDINSAAWNTALLGAAANAFPLAIQALIKAHPSLRYSWIRYLPTAELAKGQLHGFHDNLFRRLKATAILESRSGKMVTPSSLIFVPAKYRDPDGVPITLTKTSEGVYLSPQYDDEDWKYLEILGVKELTQAQFLAHLKTCLRERNASSPAKALLAERHQQWHSRLAAILLRVATPKEMEDLPVIPLRNGTWVTSRDPAFFFNNRSGKTTSTSEKSEKSEKQQQQQQQQDVPKGIDIPVIDPRAAEDTDRHLLMTALGVKDFKEEDVAKLIVEAHRSREFRPEKLTVADLVGHAEFLYKTRFLSTLDEKSAEVDLWIAIEDGRRLRASATYIRPDPPDLGASKYLKPAKNSTYGFAHKAYLDAFETADEDGHKWLQRALGMEVWPRFLNAKYVAWDKAPSTTDARKLIHPDFLEIMDSSKSKNQNRNNRADFLQVIAEGWKPHYSFHFEILNRAVLDVSSPTSSSSKKPTALEVAVKYIRRFHVSCCNGLTSVPLEETMLPIPHLQRMVPWCRSFLDVPSPEHEGWACLAHLGVQVEGDLRFYLRCLQYAKEANVSFANVPHIMRQVQARADEDIALLTYVSISFYPEYDT